MKDDGLTLSDYIHGTHQDVFPNFGIVVLKSVEISIWNSVDKVTPIIGNVGSKTSFMIELSSPPKISPIK